MNSFKKNKQAVNVCKNYYKIINTPIYEGDTITQNIINIYEDYIFGMETITKREKEKLIKVDNIMLKFITDARFKKELVQVLSRLKVSKKVGNLVEYVISKIIEFSEDYKDYYTRNIYIPRWI